MTPGDSQRSERSLSIRVADRVLFDLGGRKGVGNALEECDRDVLQEIRESLAECVDQELASHGLTAAGLESIMGLAREFVAGGQCECEDFGEDGFARCWKCAFEAALPSPPKSQLSQGEIDQLLVEGRDIRKEVMKRFPPSERYKDAEPNT